MLKTRDALVPPKPKELHIAERIKRSLDLWGTKSRSHPSEGSSKFKVGGTIPWFNAKIVNTDSTAPAAPNKWPIDYFVDDIDRS